MTSLAPMSMTYFYIVAAAAILVFAFIGYAISKWALKQKTNSANLMYAGVGAILGVVVAVVVYFVPGAVEKSTQKESEPVPQQNMSADEYLSRVKY